MDMADLMVLLGLEFLYDVLEERYGSLVAALVTITSAIIILGIVVWMLAHLLSR